MVRAPFLVHRQPSFHCVFTWWKRARDLSGASFIRELIPFMRAPSSLPNRLPKAPHPNTITLGIRFQHMNWAGNIDIQSIAEGRWLSIV